MKFVLQSSLIVDTNEVQTAGRNTGAGQASVPCVQNCGDLTFRQLAGTNVKQRSDNRPDHVLKETVAADPEDPLLFAALAREFVNRPHTILGFTGAGAEGGEIVRTQKVQAGGVHGGCV